MMLKGFWETRPTGGFKSVPFSVVSDLYGFCVDCCGVSVGSYGFMTIG